MNVKQGVPPDVPSESGLWKTMRTELGKFGVLQRIESPITSGVPDVVYCVGGSSGWVELKEHPWPKRATTRMRIPHLKQEQVNFARAWSRAGGRSFLLLQAGSRDYVMFDVVGIELLHEGATRADLLAIARVRGNDGFPTAKILRVLRGVDVHNEATGES